MSRSKARSTISFNPLDDIESIPPISNVEPELTKAAPVKEKKRTVQSSKPRSPAKKKSPLNKTTEKSKKVQPLVKTQEPQPDPQLKVHSEAQPESLQNNIPTNVKRHIVSFRDGSTISHSDIIRDADSGEWGFLEPAGRFVSLMHLSEPVDTGRNVRDNFAAMGLMGAFFAGPLGLLAASIFHSGRQTIFRARQSSSRDMYVSLNHESLRFLNNVIYGKGMPNG